MEAGLHDLGAWLAGDTGWRIDRADEDDAERTDSRNARATASTRAGRDVQVCRADWPAVPMQGPRPEDIPPSARRHLVTLPWRNRSVPLFGMLALLGALACERQADSLSAPTGPSRSSAIASDSSFYYYQGRPIPLDIDPTQIVVESQVKNLAPIANALLVGVGASVSDSIALPQAANHRILLVRGGSEQHLGSVIKALRADARFSFVSGLDPIKWTHEC